ncbi:MAG: YajG family lipoprotein [Campylobacter sp.]|nr:YajG family lipoprotein [Campylobacter sp.]
MRKIILLIIALVFVGCSKNATVVNLGSYQTLSDKAYNDKFVTINSVKDTRENPNLIGEFLDSDGAVKSQAFLSSSLDEWLKDALTKELKALGVTVSDNADTSVDVRISSAKATIQSFKKDNLKASVELFLSIQKGETTITKRVAQSGSKFVAIASNSDIEPYMRELLYEIVKQSAKQIANSL